MMTQWRQPQTLQKGFLLVMGAGGCILIGLLVGLERIDWGLSFLGGLAALLVSLLRPQWGLYLLLWVLFTTLLPVGAGKFLGGVVMVGWMVGELVRGRRVIHLGAAGPWLIALLILALLSGLANGQVGTQQLLLIGTGLILYLLILNLTQTRLDFELLLLNLILIGVVGSALVIRQSLTGVLRPGALAQGALADPNVTALYLNLMLPFVIVAATRPWGWRWLARLALPILLAGILLTLSRAGFLVALFSLLSLFWFRRTIRRLELLVILGALLAWQWAPLITTNVDSLLRRFSRADISAWSSAEARLNTWRVGARLGMENVWFGAGPGRFGEEIVDYRVNEFGLIALAPHNTYLQAFAELGAPGLLALAGVLFQSFRQLYRVWRAPTGPQSIWLPAVAAMFSGYLLSIFFLNQLYARDFFLAVALVQAFASLYATVPDAPAALPQPDLVPAYDLKP